MFGSDYLWYKQKGDARVFFDGTALQIRCKDYPEYTPKDLMLNRVIGDLMDGEEFYEHVDSGGFIDEDGLLANVYINGYNSNLGLCHKGLAQGGFLVDGATWLKLCNEYTIEVEWCNK